MYQIKCGSNIIYDPRLEELKLIDPQLNLELNKVGELTFGILAVHPYFETLQKMKSIVTVYDDDVMIFRGRILNDESGFYNDKDIVCEGELAFLNDTIQRPYNFTGTPAQLFTQFINAHNAQSTASHQFKIGNITVTDPNNYIARADSGYTNTWKSINDKLIGRLGGYLWVRHEADGNYIDYLTDFNTLNPQPIEFGVNLLDFRKKMKGEEIATAIIPLGAEDEETGIRTTIESVNGGIDYVYSQEAVNEYGWIFKVVEWDDVTVPSNLLTKANAYLANAINLQGSIELDALDLPEQNSFKLGSYIKVKSEHHGIPDENFLISKLDLNLSNPADNKVTLGKVFSTFADESLNTDKKNGQIIEVIHNVTNNIKGYVVEKANDAEANAKAYADGLKTAIDADISAVETSVTNLDNEINTTFKDGVIQEAEAKAIEKYLNTVNAEKADLDSRYTKIYGDADLTGTQKTDLASKKTAYNTAHTNLINSINTAIADGKTTPTEKADVDNKFTAYRTALSNLATSFETAIRAIEAQKIANIQIGGRNLLLKSDVPVTNSTYPTQRYDMTEKMSTSKTYTIRLWGTLGAGKTGFTAYLNGGSISLGGLTNNGDGTFSLTFAGKDSGVTTGDFINVHAMPSGNVVDSTIEKIKLEVGNKATDYTKAPEDDQQYVNDTVNQLSQQLNSAIEQSSTNIRTEISEQYYTKGQAEQLVSSVGTELEQTKKGFNFQFTQMAKNLNDVQVGNDAEFSEIRKYIRFEDGNIILGESTNNVTLKIENNQIGFYVGGVKVSYWLVDETGANPPKFYVTDGEFLNSLRLGNFAFTPRTNGNLSFGKVV